MPLASHFPLCLNPATPRPDGSCRTIASSTGKLIGTIIALWWESAEAQLSVRSIPRPPFPNDDRLAAQIVVALHTRPNDRFSHVYHWFNIAEGAAWCAIAYLAMRRFVKHRKSRLEIVYAAAFVTFGVSDFVEAHTLTTWLILAKGANLALLFALRRYLLGRYYPGSKTY
jgi:hypothetical protein